MENYLRKIYYNSSHPAGFAGLHTVLRQTKDALKAKDVKKWLQSQDTYTLHKPVRINFKRNKCIVNNIDQCWQADLNDMRGLAEYNDKFKYILAVIDVFSKYGFMVPLKDKTGSSVKKAFEQIFSKSGRKPENLQTDKGSEFTSRNVRNFLKINDVSFYTTKNPDVKASVIERWNRAIKTRMWRYFTFHNTYRYVDVLERLVETYNNTYHSTIRMAPVEVNESNLLQVWQNLYRKKIINKKPQYEIGDLVRISREQNTFEKGYETKWSEEVFKIVRVIRHPRPVYEIEDLNNKIIDGYFYEPEIQKVRLESHQAFKIDKILSTKGKGRSKQYLVVWKGYPSEFNSWVSATQLVKISNG